MSRTLAFHIQENIQDKTESYRNVFDRKPHPDHLVDIKEDAESTNHNNGRKNYLAILDSRTVRVQDQFHNKC